MAETACDCADTIPSNACLQYADAYAIGKRILQRGAETTKALAGFRRDESRAVSKLPKAAVATEAAGQKRSAIAKKYADLAELERGKVFRSSSRRQPPGASGKLRPPRLRLGWSLWWRATTRGTFARLRLSGRPWYELPMLWRECTLIESGHLLVWMLTGCAGHRRAWAISARQFPLRVPSWWSTDAWCDARRRPMRGVPSTLHCC